MTHEILIADGTNVDQVAPKADFAVISFSRQNVEHGLIGDALDRLMSLSDSPSFVAQFEDRMALKFDGYDDDPRELSQIPECVVFFRALTQQWPYWYHFLEKNGPSISIVIQLLCDMRVVQTINGRVGCEFVSLDEFRGVAMRLFDGMNTLYEAHGIDEAQNVAMSKKVNDAILRL